MKTKKLYVKNRYGYNLEVYLDLPDTSKPESYGIISHCFTCSKNYKIYENLSKYLTNKNIAVFRFDMMGLGNSEGNFKETTFTTNVRDLLDIASFIKNNFDSPIFLIGHSLGGLISIEASFNITSIKGIATIGSPNNFNNLINFIAKFKQELYNKGEADIKIANRNFKVGYNFLKDIKNHNINNSIENLTKPIILFHSNKDTIVPYKEGLELFNKINSNKTFVTLNGANHLISNKVNNKYIVDIFHSWINNIK